MRRPLPFYLLLPALLVLLLHMAVTGGHVQSPDEELLYRMAEGIATKGSTAVIPLEADISTGALPTGFPKEATFATKLGKDQESFYAQYLPLQPLLAVPFVWAAIALEGSFAAPFATALQPGMAMQYLTPLEGDAFASAAFRRAVVVLFFNPLVSLISFIVMARLVRLLIHCRTAATWTALAWALGTIAWAHSRSFFTEPLAGLFALIALDQLARWYLKPLGSGVKHSILMGIALGLANLTRVDAPFMTVGFGAVMLAMSILKYMREESWGSTTVRFPFTELFITGSIAFGAWLALQSFNTIRFGPDLTSGYGNQSEGVKFTTPLLVGLHGLIASPGKGLLFFSPALILGIWGWRRTPAHLRWFAWSTLAAFAPFTLAMATWQNWDGGWCWGPRHIVQIHLPLMLGAMFFFQQPISLKRRTIAGAVLAVGIGVQLYGSSQCSLDYFREFFTTYRDHVYHRVNLRGAQEGPIRADFAFYLRERDGSLGREAEPSNFPAPLIDSLYLPQHSQWYSYATMWKLGYCDLYLLNLFRSEKGPDRWTEDS